MSEQELISEAFDLLGMGRVEAAEALFARFMEVRVRVGDEGPLREMWVEHVARKRAEIMLREQSERQAGGKWRRVCRTG